MHTVVAAWPFKASVAPLTKAGIAGAIRGAGPLAALVLTDEDSSTALQTLGVTAKQLLAGGAALGCNRGVTFALVNHARSSEHVSTPLRNISRI